METNDKKTPVSGSWKKLIDYRYLAGEDFEDKIITMTVKSVTKEEAFNTRSKRNEKVIVLNFNETDKGIILNLTNSRTITRILKTDKVDEWIGKKIDFYGKIDNRFGRVIRIKEDLSNIKV